MIWTGAPRAGLLWRPIECVLIPFSLFWAGFAIFWNVSVWQAGAPPFMRLFGVPFLVASAYVTVGRFIVDAWIRSRTEYLVTTRRVVIKRPCAAERSLDIGRLPSLELDERGNGSGTIRFESAPNVFARGNGFGFWSPALGGPAQFLALTGAVSVYELIARQSAQASVR